MDRRIKHFFLRSKSLFFSLGLISVIGLALYTLIFISPPIKHFEIIESEYVCEPKGCEFDVYVKQYSELSSGILKVDAFLEESTIGYKTTRITQLASQKYEFELSNAQANQISNFISTPLQANKLTFWVGYIE